MKYLLFVLVAVACLFASGECQKKAPSGVKTLNRLCKKLLSPKGVEISDGNFTQVFDDMKEWCVGFVANLSDYFVIEPKMKAFNPVREMSKSCRWFERRYKGRDKEPEPIFIGFEKLCYDFEYAKNVSDGIIVPTETPTKPPRRTPKAMERLVLMCKRAEKGKLKWFNESFDDTFNTIIAWCPDFLTDIKGVEEWWVVDVDKMAGERKYVAEKEIAFICRYVFRKYPLGIPSGPLVALPGVCDGAPIDYSDDDKDYW